VRLALGAASGGALFAALTYGLASPMWPLATLFLGHAISAAGLVIAFAAAVALGDTVVAQPFRAASARDHGSPEGLRYDSRRRDVLLGLAVGLGGGWATVWESPAAVPAALIAALAALHAWNADHDRVVRVVAAITAGALTCAAILMA